MPISAQNFAQGNIQVLRASLGMQVLLSRYSPWGLENFWRMQICQQIILQCKSSSIAVEGAEREREREGERGREGEMGVSTC